MESNACETRYRDLVEGLVEKWAEGKPPNPTAESPSAKPSGYYRLSGWLFDYLMAHDALPTGVHAMPEGIDRQGRVEPSFPVDFSQPPFKRGD